MPMMKMTGITGMYGGLQGTPETTTVLAKREPEVDASGLSYDTADQQSSCHSSPQ